MSVLDLFRRPCLVDPRLGTLRFARKRWTSDNASCFGDHVVQLRIPGTRAGIDPQSRALLDALERTYSSLQSEMTAQFYEHYQGYDEAVEVIAELSVEAASVIRGIHGPIDLWPHIRLIRVWMNAYGRPGDVEFGYRTGWDIEHMIGVVVAKGRVADFCGSVGPWW